MTSFTSVPNGCRRGQRYAYVQCITLPALCLVSFRMGAHFCFGAGAWARHSAVRPGGSGGELAECFAPTILPSGNAPTPLRFRKGRLANCALVETSVAVSSETCCNRLNQNNRSAVITVYDLAVISNVGGPGRAMNLPGISRVLSCALTSILAASLHRVSYIVLLSY